MEILRWRGVLKAKIFKQKYEPKLEFPEGWVAQTKKSLRGESMDIFSQKIYNQFHKLMIKFRM